MESKKLIKTLLLVLLVNSTGFAAKRMYMVQGFRNQRIGVLRFQGTISAGYMTQFKALHIQLHGDLEYFLNERISARSDIYYSLAVNNSDPVPPFKFNHSMFSGIQYHFTPFKAIDFYAGFQPGVALCKRRYEQFDATGVPPQLPAITTNVNPVFSINTGITYYGNRFFNAFVHVRYLTGFHQDNYRTASLDELRISFGLGFFFRMKKNYVPGPHNMPEF
ncbi:MAG: hypothetical protein ACHQF2_03160 [Flavobacteriales bacterium]